MVRAFHYLGNDECITVAPANTSDYTVSHRRCQRLFRGRYDHDLHRPAAGSPLRRKPGGLFVRTTVPVRSARQLGLHGAFLSK